MRFDISVVIPTYNRSDLLPATLDSVLGQTYSPKEVVVVDDGSTDDTEAVARRYGAKVRYIRIPNSGPGKARDLGVEAAKGAWIALCDSDDLWRPQKLELQARVLEFAGDAEHCFTDTTNVVDGVWDAKTHFSYAPDRYWEVPRREAGDSLFVVDVSLYEKLLEFQPIHISSVLMTKALYDRVGGWNDELNRLVGDDFEFHFRCVDHPPLGVVAQPMVGFRQHAASLTYGQLKQLMGDINILRYVLERHPRAQDYASRFREEIHRRTVEAAYGAFYERRADLHRQLVRSLPLHRRPFALWLRYTLACLPEPAFVGATRLVRAAKWLLRGQ